MTQTMETVRPVLVWIHRWVGLLMALLLLIEGVTGSILAFEDAIGRWLNPGLYAPASESAQPTLDFADLATAAERLAPQAQVAYFSVAPDQAMMRCLPRNDRRTGKPYDIGFDHLVLDPHKGREVARLSSIYHGPDAGSGILPFVKNLHYNLALGSAGTWVLFFLALAWTLDAFVSFALTLPMRLLRFWPRWKPAWVVKRGAGAYRINFDLHRAGGLWFWAAAFAFAWSSVQMEDHWGTYDWVTGKLFDYVAYDEMDAALPRHADVPLKLDWHAAQRRGEELMAQKARLEGFRALRPSGLVHFIDNGLYNYSVTTDRGFPRAREETVFFDGDSGAPFAMPGFSDHHLGNAVTDWLRALHMVTDPVDLLAYRWFVFGSGLVLSMLSVTGIVIWLKKRRGRMYAARRARAPKALAAPS